MNMTPAYSRRGSLLALWRSYGLGLLMLTLACLMAMKPVHAQLRVDISGTGATQYPVAIADFAVDDTHCLLYTSPSPRDQRGSRMPSSA